MNTKVNYTCLVGGYDELRQPLAIDESFDYVCFTDHVTAERIGVWQLRPIPFKTRDKVLLSRYAKILPHKVLADYEYSVYMDANVQILTADFYDVLTQHIEAGDLIAQVPHPHRKCVYQELYACWHHGMISLLANVSMRRALHRMKMPECFGLYENNLILRRHNDGVVANVSDLWWRSFRSSMARRDQLTLMPVYWQTGVKPALLFGEGKNTRNVDCVKWFAHVHRRNERKPKSRFELFLMRLANGAERRGWL